MATEICVNIGSGNGLLPDDPSITEIICKIKYLKFHSNFAGANELIHWHFSNDMIASVPVKQCNMGKQITIIH